MTKPLTAQEMRDFIEAVEAHREEEFAMFQPLAADERLLAKEILERRDAAREASGDAESLIGSCDYTFDELAGEPIKRTDI